MAPTILIVDDDPIVRRLIKQSLMQASLYSIMEASSGDEAWRLLNQGLHPALCILDIMMPGTDGIELLNLMRGHSATRGVKVIMCTTLNNRMKIAESMALEVEDYILKPFRPQRIQDAVEKALQPRAEKLATLLDAGGAGRNSAAPGVTRVWLQSVALDIEESLGSLANENRDHISRKLEDLMRLCAGPHHQDLLASVQELQTLVVTASSHEVFDRLNQIARAAQQKAKPGLAVAG